MKFISKFFATFVLMAAVFTVSPSAHTYHTSLSRIDLNHKDKSLEIEINLFNHDLERLLEVKNQKRIDIEKSGQVDKLIYQYLVETFVIKDVNDNLKKLVWIGKEIKTDMTTIYVEVDGVENFADLKLQNKIFFESFSEQINLVTLHNDEEKIDLMFKVGDNFKDFISDTRKQR